MDDQITPARYRKQREEEAAQRLLKLEAEWATQDLQADSRPPDADVHPSPSRAALLFLPNALAGAIFPQRGRHLVLVRRFGAFSSIAASGYDLSGKALGLPSSLISRRLLFFLSSEARRLDSPVVEVPSYRVLLESCGLAGSGSNILKAKKTLHQLQAMTLDIVYPVGPEKLSRVSGRIFTEVILATCDRQTVMRWAVSKVEFSEPFFKVIQSGRPYRLDLIHAARSAHDHDVLVWLHHRLSRPDAQDDYEIPWPSLYAQFASEGQPIRKFKEWFRASLRRANKILGSKALAQRSGVNIGRQESRIPNRFKAPPKPRRKYSI